MVPVRMMFLRNRGKLLTGWRNARGQDRCRRGGIIAIVLIFCSARPEPQNFCLQGRRKSRV